MIDRVVFFRFSSCFSFYRATVDVFNKQIEESKVSLSVERKDR